MKRNILLSCVLIAIMITLTTSCNNNSCENKANRKDSLSGDISISGAFALYPITVKWAEEYMKLYPKVTINVSAGGAGKGMTDALSDMIDLGMYSKSVSDEEKQKGAWWIGVTKDAVLATINAKNPYLKEIQASGLTMEKFYDIFITNKITNWGYALGINSKSKLNVYTRSDACGAAEMWAKYLNNHKQEDIQGIGVNGDPGVADAVKKDIFGIGFNNIVYVYEMTTRKKYDGIEVVPVDLNKNGKIEPEENIYNTLDDIMAAIKDGRYPSPPARDLFFVSKGKPQRAVVKHFLNWVLTDGQKYVNEAGYVLLSDESIKAELEKIE